MYNALELEKTAAVLLLPVFYTPMLARCSRSTQTNCLYLRVEYLINMLWFSQIVFTCANYARSVLLLLQQQEKLGAEHHLRWSIPPYLVMCVTFCCALIGLAMMKLI